MRLGESTTVCVTGGSGFIGSAIVRALRERGCTIRVLVEPGASPAELHDAEVVFGDVRDCEAVRRAVRGADVVFHTAAIYRFWARDPRIFRAVNILGTRNVITEAAEASRIVYTSTVGTLGLPDSSTPTDETDPADVAHLFGPYKRSKYVAEHEVLRLAAQGAPVVLTHPTFPLGYGDRTPTPTGRLVRDFLDGRIPAYVDTTLNVVDVDDVACGHVLAAEEGCVGRSYILGGENLSLRELLTVAAQCAELPPPRIRLPNSIGVLVGAISELAEGRMLRREPTYPLEAARMSSTKMRFDDSRARRELGYRSKPARVGIENAVAWFRSRGAGRARDI